MMNSQISLQNIPHQTESRPENLIILKVMVQTKSKMLHFLKINFFVK